MRCELGAKKVARLQARFPRLGIVAASVRGNNQHAILLYCADDSQIYLETDGTLNMITSHAVAPVQAELAPSEPDQPDHWERLREMVLHFNSEGR